MYIYNCIYWEIYCIPGIRKQMHTYHTVKTLRWQTVRNAGAYSIYSRSSRHAQRPASANPGIKYQYVVTYNLACSGNPTLKASLPVDLTKDIWRMEKPNKKEKTLQKIYSSTADRMVRWSETRVGTMKAKTLLFVQSHSSFSMLRGYVFFVRHQLQPTC